MTSVIRGSDDFDSGEVLGQNQTWQDMTGSRADDTEYTNTTGRPISVKVISAATASSRLFIVDGLTIDRADTNDATTIGIGGIVPAGSTYKAFNVGAATWLELR